MNGDIDPTKRIFQRLQDLGWKSPDQVAEMRRRLWTCGGLRGPGVPPPRNSVIKRCPHCGGLASLLRDPTDEIDLLYYVECATCMVRTLAYEDPCEPIKTWNRRRHHETEEES